MLERASNEYGKSIRCSAEHASDQVSEVCLSDQKEELLFQWKCEISGAARGGESIMRHCFYSNKGENSKLFCFKLDTLYSIELEA